VIPELDAIKIDGFFGDFEPVECIAAGFGAKALCFYILLRFTIVALVLANVKIGTPNPN
jgi:hypothetical protein